MVGCMLTRDEDRIGRISFSRSSVAAHRNDKRFGWIGTRPMPEMQDISGIWYQAPPCLVLLVRVGTEKWPQLNAGNMAVRMRNQRALMPQLRQRLRQPIHHPLSAAIPRRR